MSMKISIFIPFLIFNLFLANTKSVGENEFRPYTKFYEKGKEKERFEEYLKFKDGDTAKKYSNLFSKSDFENLSIYQIVYQSGYNNEIKILSAGTYGNFLKKDIAMEEFVNFFDKAFPELVRKPPADEAKGQILIFSGPSRKCAIFVPGINGPEFMLVNGLVDKVTAGATYKTSDGAMSATRPFKYFWKMFGNEK